jgi:uncharacterized repeat protein (TIGR03803 family)
MDGSTPAAPLAVSGGTLFGTTQNGGDCSMLASGGCGTAFSITSCGVEKVVHRFQGGDDGLFPEAGFIRAGSKLYTTVMDGGTGNVGMVAEVTPPDQENAYQGPDS